MFRSLPTYITLLFVGFHGAITLGVDAPAADHPGALIFAQQCASCHGEHGEGTPDAYPEPLFGDKSSIDLSEYIDATMPEGEEDLCTGEDAKSVADWMQDAFYSPEAQARINPPRLSTMRMTVAQYRNAIADLTGSFLWKNDPNDKEGLSARYYNKRRLNNKEKALERLDPEIDFDFGEGTPDPKMKNKEEFSIRWEGSLVVDETGWYDFRVITPNAVRFFINDRRDPLVDAWVKSGDTTEFGGSRFLLSGQLYPLLLEWFTWKEKTSSVKLMWKKPHGEWETIPSNHLSPQTTREVIAIETPFPPDDRSDGYIRGTSVSREWHEAVAFAAVEAVDQWFPLLPEVAKLRRDDNEEQRRRKLIEFCRLVLYRAFRRPAGKELQNLYVGRHFAPEVSADDATRRCLLAILMSPRFLYRDLTRGQDLFARGERLTFALVNSIPDRGMLEAAEKGWLTNDRGLRDQAWRMINTHRGRTRLHEFLRVWLNLERLEDGSKDPELYGEFDSHVLADMRSSLELLLREAVTMEEGGFRRLLASDETWLNGRLASFYQLDESHQKRKSFQKVKFQSNKRAGVVAHPFLLTALAYQKTSSPIHRGVFLSRGLLGRTMKPPPDSVSPVAPDLEPHLTTRQRVGKQTSPALCSNCHTMINGLGFALEEFDAVGRLRETEKSLPIDASGQYRMRSGKLAKFNGARELAEFLVQSRETHRSFVRQLFHHMVQQPILAYGPNTIDDLADFFAETNFDMKQLMVRIAIIAANGPTEE